MIRAWLISGLVGVLMAVFAAGCGDGDGTAATTGGTAGAPLSKAAFIDAADAICRNTDETQNAELSSFVKDNPKAESTEAGQIEMITAAGLPPVQTEVEELRELGPPEGDEDEVEAILAGMEKALKASEADPSSVLKSAGNPFEEVGAAAAKYGFKECNNAL